MTPKKKKPTTTIAPSQERVQSSIEDLVIPDGSNALEAVFYVFRKYAPKIDVASLERHLSLALQQVGPPPAMTDELRDEVASHWIRRLTPKDSHDIRVLFRTIITNPKQEDDLKALQDKYKRVKNLIEWLNSQVVYAGTRGVIKRAGEAALATLRRLMEEKKQKEKLTEVQEPVTQ